MKKHTLSIVLPLLLWSGLSAQVTVQDIITDSVDVFSRQSDRAMKSSNLAMAASLLIPGLGHHYLGKAEPALALISLDVLSVFGAIFCNQHSKGLLTDSRGYAGTYARIVQGREDENYWNMVGEFDDMDSYNEAVRLNRQSGDEITDSRLSWKWDSDYYKDEYRKIRKNSHRFKTAASLCLGAMVLNRLVAFVDIRAKTRYKGVTSTSFHLQPSISPDFSSAGILISKQF
ncbi:MAG: hypothetical protein GX556_15790 [Fibrobacter sp.]|nr:hypothetical protein [Fibrobacter sp.]